MLDLTRLGGIFPPILTPLTADERLDASSLRHLLDFLVEGKVHGIWLLGSTGEFPALSSRERAAAATVTLEHVRGRLPVVVNVSDGSTGLVIEHARAAVEAGADAIAATPPYYFPNSMDELVSHYRAIKETFPDTPLLVYNYPQMVKTPLALSAVLELARSGTVQGIKDSQNDLSWFRLLVLGIRELGLENQFRMFLGTRSLIDAGMLIGAHGAIPACSNVAPRACVEVFEACRRGDMGAAEQAQLLALRYEDLAHVAQGGSANAASFSSMKHTLRMWGVIEHATVTRPLRALAPTEVEELRQRLAGLPLGTSEVGSVVGLASK